MDEYTNLTYTELLDLAKERNLTFGKGRPKKKDVIAILNAHDHEGQPFRDNDFSSKEPESTGNKVALYFDKPVDFRLQNRGIVKRGYKIVDEAEVEFYLQWPDLVRLATPQEVAAHYGV